MRSLTSKHLIHLDKTEGLESKLLVWEKLAIDCYGVDHAITLDLNEEISSLYWRQKRFREAEVRMRRSFEYAVRNGGSECEDALRAQGHLLLLRGESQNATMELLSEWRDLLNKLEIKYGKDHRKTWGVRNSYGSDAFDLKQYDAALIAFLFNAKCQERELGLNNSETCSTLSNAGNALTALGHYSEAKILQSKAYCYIVSLLGAGHSISLQLLRNLVGTYKSDPTTPRDISMVDLLELIKSEMQC